MTVFMAVMAAGPAGMVSAAGSVLARTPVPVTALAPDAQTASLLGGDVARDAWGPSHSGAPALTGTAAASDARTGHTRKAGGHRTSHSGHGARRSGAHSSSGNAHGHTSRAGRTGHQRASKSRSKRGGQAHHSRRHVCHAPGLHGWICHAEVIMLRHGVPGSALNSRAAYIVVRHESGGNPHAYNGWDSNATAGTPSEGIAQVISPTFAAYALPHHDNIWNPVDNMIAAFRYAVAKYGSMNNIPGVVAVRHGMPYIGY